MEQSRYTKNPDTVNTVYTYAVSLEDGSPADTIHSETCFAVTGYTSKELAANHYLWIKMVAKEDHNAVLKQVGQLLSGHFPEAIEHRIIRKDGSVCWVESSVFPNYNSDNVLVSYNGIIRDITERKKARERVREKEKHFRTAALAATDLIYDFDVESGTVNWSGDITSCLGSAEGDFSNTAEEWMKIIHPEDLDKVMTAYKDSALTMEPANFYYRIRRKDGTYRNWEEHAIPVSFHNGRPVRWVGAIRDVTRFRKIEKQLRKAAITDHLTGLLNRQGFLAIAGLQCKSPECDSGRTCLFYFDIDDLKNINDTLGYKAGDQALIDTAKILKMVFRKSDIIARTGGDEFAVLVSGHPDPDIESTVNMNITGLLNAYNEHKGRSHKLSLSRGNAYHDPGHPCSVNGLLARADSSMRKNKVNRTGSNLVPFLKEKKSDERKHRRFRINGSYSATISVSDSVRIKDISLSGMRLETLQYLNINNIYDIRIISADGQDLTLTGEVVWSSLNKEAAEKCADVPCYEAGLSLDGSDEGQRAFLEDLITGLEAG
ncbi:MAG: PAS domain-containing protein [Nitrospirota bacterium]|nr:PAS domain-containing protein [Nitrospirota bacterium]